VLPILSVTRTKNKRHFNYICPEMTNHHYIVRHATSDEFTALGNLMVSVYSQLEGFPKPDEQPKYYGILANIGNFTSLPETELLVAVSENGQIAGGVVYFGDMQYYGSGAPAPN
jgi:hypothetical protein